MKDYFQYQDLWSNKKDCCDALGFVKGITKTSQDVAWAERHKHAPSKELSLAAEQLEKAMISGTAPNGEKTTSILQGAETKFVSRIKWQKSDESQPPV
jgi:hypothetical protein